MRFECAAFVARHDAFVQGFLLGGGASGGKSKKKGVKKKRKEKKDKLNPFSVKQGGGVGASDATTSGRMWGDLF